MHIMYADESNLDPNTVFFVYAGLAFPNQKMAALHDEIEGIRENLGVPRDYILKFNPGPASFSHSEFIRLKSEVLEACARAGARMFVSAIHHGIIKDGDVDGARRNAINTILYHFDCYLNPGREDDRGLVLIDRFSDKQIDAHLRDKMTVGLTGMPYSHEYKLTRLLGVHYSAIGQAHFPSLVDVAVGSLRFSINAHVKQHAAQIATAATLLKLLQPMFFMDSGKVSEICFSLSPKRILSDRYRGAYESLKTFLSGHGIDLAQDVQ